MTLLTPDSIQEHINERAYDTLINEGLGGTDLSDYTVGQLQEIHGIGPKWAKEIRAALNNVASPQEHPKDDEAYAAMEQALALLTGCDRRADVANLKNRLIYEPASDVVETAIAILEQLPGGNRGKNLAAQVREMLA